MTKPIEKLGIYGGTFAPVHNGHIYAIRQLISACQLDRLLIIPTKKPPHKEMSAEDDPIHRLQMLRLAFPEGDIQESGIEVCDFEINSPSPSYTAITLSHFAKEGRQLTFFCGSDMFRTLDTWYRPDLIFSLARIVHIPRTDLSAQEWEELDRLTLHYEETYGARISHLRIPPYPLSSTEVRNCIAKGQPIDDLVPRAVAEYIALHGLYRKDEV